MKNLKMLGKHALSLLAILLSVLFLIGAYGSMLVPVFNFIDTLVLLTIAFLLICSSWISGLDINLSNTFKGFLVFLILAAMVIGSLKASVWIAEKRSAMPSYGITQEHSFNLISWEHDELSKEIANVLIFWQDSDYASEKEEAEAVFTFFDLINEERHIVFKEIQGEATNSDIQRLEHIREEIKAKQWDVEKIMEDQLKETLADMGISLLPGRSSLFTHFYSGTRFRLMQPPRKVVIAYRDKLTSKAGVYIKYETSTEDIEAIEAKVKEAGYSGLVVPLGGIATYPSIVNPQSVHRSLATIAHEWSHHYFGFTALGKSTSPEQRNIEETSASIIGYEIRDIMWERYYAPYIKETSITGRVATAAASINKAEELRKTRERVVEYLESGQIEEAEAYMNERRDWLEENGYYIRKLNQAYFVFYGYYATNPAFRNANGGIGQKLIDLRGSSASLKDFLLAVSEIQTIEDIDKHLAHLTK